MHVTEGLIKDLKTVVGDADKSVRAAGERMKDATEAAGTQALDAARDVNRQVHDHPWTAVGVAAAVGLIVGILLVRK